MSINYTALTWLATYFVHSTVLLCGAYAISRLFARNDPAVRDLVWKTAAVGAIVTSVFAVAIGPRGVDRPGEVAFEHAVSATEGSAVAWQLQDRVWQSPPPPVEMASADTRSSAIHLSELTARLLLLGWLLVGGFLTGTLVFRRARFIRRIGRRRPVFDGPMYEQLITLSDRYDVDDLALTMAPRISGPAVLSRKEICVPLEATTDLDPLEQRALIAHEFAHVLRRDPAWLRGLHVIERVLFFQPLNRVACLEFEQAAEELCDNWVVDRTGEANSLATCLVRVARWVRGEDVGFASMAGRPLRSRIERLVSGRHAVSGRERFAAVGLVGLLGLVVAAWTPAIEVERQEARSTADDPALVVEHVAPDAGRWIPAPPPPVAVSRQTPPPPPVPALYGAPKPPVALRGVLSVTRDTIIVTFERDDEWTFVSGDVSTTFSGLGRVTLRRNGAISVISPGGYFSVRTEGEELIRTVTARPSSPSSIAYEYEEDGTSRPFAAGAQNWLRDSIRMLVERMTVVDPRHARVMDAELRAVERAAASTVLERNRLAEVRMSERAQSSEVLLRELEASRVVERAAEQEQVVQQLLRQNVEQVEQQAVRAAELQKELLEQREQLLMQNRQATDQLVRELPRSENLLRQQDLELLRQREAIDRIRAEYEVELEQQRAIIRELEERIRALQREGR